MSDQEEQESGSFMQLDKKAHKKSGRPKSIIWGTYIKQGRRVSPGHYNATCKFCDKFWYKGSPEECENHLANFCQKVPTDARDLFLNRLAARAINNNSQEPPKTKRKLNDHSAQPQAAKNQTKVVDFIESTRLTEGRINEINRALVKAFVVCGIPWQTIENPFFIEFLKTLRPGYTPPSKDTLSGRLLAQESAVVNQQVIKKLENQENLTLCRLSFYLGV
jgi:hypothetical protein